MYEYLTGLVTVVAPQYIVVDVNGVGYKLLVANPYRYQEDQTKKVQVYVYQAVREDNISLFGFTDQNEKKLFMQLINVSGIGPKSALAILANPDHQGLVDAITNNNVSYLTKFPGIGKKTASQIVLDLRDKLTNESSSSLFATTQLAVDATVNSELKDALEALAALGYKERDIKKVQKTLMKEEQMATDEYLRQALRLLN
ncbi:Holliday junction branch migration protein RuvA [Limosilactobacillus agrestis]|uniref:Holliday junction branch migration complex subunit RuvA n=1 Tax=Limosilactobacillus agrestis TaxID=2759748 RepID=A0ABS8R5U8_9LACO|nr:Holliday junction branch migration protein RuvA [Limosilactobacillus agrestis]MBB1098983.1 Holliday junction branch migration protein RuvA [Limosilactobacillus agrestis]MCD7112609.1 Holliday junction branch migration protein RuvA [Limosilactobacillus agrestis]MCD7119285.1 Holliday junction branch migration protein RuvA [Limosilactobacillus agrestis]MCD7126194.1 Holliday junction branch migration protein RuvA [Limosilactobacillus agrestis]MCD7130132.1 Holliday junction branch migration prote